VSWTVLTGSGTVSLASALTDVNGEATTVWTLGKGVGAQLLRAALPSGTADTAVATGTAGAAAIMAAIDGLAQEVRAGTVSEPMVVQVQDRYGNGVPGATVAWSTDAGTLSAASGTTDSRGLASVRLTTAAVPRGHVVTARVTGVGTLTFGVTGR
jgi:adhesin/invasin